MARRTPAPSSKATRAAMWLPAKAQPMQRRIRTAMWRGNWVGAGGVMVGARGVGAIVGDGRFFRLSYNLVMDL